MNAIDQITRQSFARLPRPMTDNGAPRRTGVEIEFSGLTEAKAAEVARDLAGGEVRDAGPNAVTLEGSRLGDLKVYLDTAFRDRTGRLATAALDLARSVVPVEIVTAPLAEDQLPLLETLVQALADAGAEGSRDGLFYGFGLHLNPEVTSLDPQDLGRVMTAYALIEDWLRLADPIDPSRRVLPFSDPYPRAYLDDLAATEHFDTDTLFDLYLRHNATRNRGLDVLPILGELDKDRLESALHGLGAVSSRPTWHYRLPDCRIGRPEWTIAYEWNRWVTVERLANDTGRLERLKSDWRQHRSELLKLRSDWRQHVTGFLADEGLLP
ncbi:amidoligase family protein [Pelagovum pacificum]|nr:amidoligase family protein [Pelagovum pacificum]QQA42482.1 amidoligase family protein [Pelagovum pacificum]